MTVKITAEKKIALNIYLLKEKPSTDKAPSFFWSRDDVLSKVEIKPGKFITLKCDTYDLGTNGQLGTLYIRKPLSESVPEWISFVETHLPNERALDKLKNKSVSALLIKQVGKRQFAIAFGHGRHMLDPNRIEHRFGIRVALNSIEPDSIASIDRQTFDSKPKLSRTQTVKPSALSDYGINTEQDLLRGMVGKVKSDYQEIGTVIAGMDSLKTALSLSLSDLEHVLITALSRAESKDYLAAADGRASAFAWVDNLQAVSDPAIISALDQALWTEFKANKFNAMWLAIPEIIDWASITGFSYTSEQANSKDAVNVLDIAEMKATLRSSATLNTLKQRSIHMVMSADGQFRTFSVYKCLYAEIKASPGDPLHVLNAGNWFQVEPSFEASVNKHLTDLPKLPFAAPFIAYNHTGEDDYNKAISSNSSSGYSLLDRKLIQFGGRHSSIEICDLYRTKPSNSERGRLVHVKRGRDSASLSHLFAQGLVSSTLLASESKFVEQVNLQLTKQKVSILPLKMPSADYDVVFAIIDGDAAKQLDLPFFGKVNLQNCVRSIKAFGFGVSLLHIPEDPAFLAKKKLNKAAKRIVKATTTKSTKS